MNKTLQALYHGDIHPAEQYLPKIEKYIIMRQNHYQHCEDFTRKLDEALVPEFESVLDEQLSMIPLEFHQAFLDGFRLGAKMVIEIYEDEN